MAAFSTIFADVTKLGTKLQTSEYLENGKHPIVDQGQDIIAGYTNQEEGLFSDVPVIVFGDHTRVVKYIDTPFFLGADGVKVLKGIRPDTDTRYLYYAVSAVRIPNTGYNRHFKWLKEADFPLPDLPTQRRIAATLDKVSEGIELCRKMLGELDELVRARFVEMFGDPVINPKGYEVHQLAEYILFLTSGSRGWAKYYSDEGEWFITIKNVKDCRISVDDVQCIKPPQNAEAERTRLREGDLLISITADLGRTGVVTKEIAEHGAYNNQHLTSIRLDQTVLDPLYVAYFMESPAGKSQFESKNMSAVKAGLNFDSIRSLKLLVPPLELQKQFVAFVAQTDKSKLVVQRQLSALETLKKSLMQKYF